MKSNAATVWYLLCHVLLRRLGTVCFSSKWCCMWPGTGRGGQRLPGSRTAPPPPPLPLEQPRRRREALLEGTNQ